MALFKSKSGAYREEARLREIGSEAELTQLKDGLWKVEEKTTGYGQSVRTELDADIASNKSYAEAERELRQNMESPAEEFKQATDQADKQFTADEEIEKQDKGFPRSGIEPRDEAEEDEDYETDEEKRNRIEKREDKKADRAIKKLELEARKSVAQNKMGGNKAVRIGKALGKVVTLGGAVKTNKKTVGLYGGVHPSYVTPGLNRNQKMYGGDSLGHLREMTSPGSMHHRNPDLSKLRNAGAGLSPLAQVIHGSKGTGQSPLSMAATASHRGQKSPLAMAATISHNSPISKMAHTNIGMIATQRGVPTLRMPVKNSGIQVPKAFQKKKSNFYHRKLNALRRK